MFNAYPSKNLNERLKIRFATLFTAAMTIKIYKYHFNNIKNSFIMY